MSLHTIDILITSLSFRQFAQVSVGLVVDLELFLLLEAVVLQWVAVLDHEGELKVVEDAFSLLLLPALAYERIVAIHAQIFLFGLFPRSLPNLFQFREVGGGKRRLGADEINVLSLPSSRPAG